MRYAIAAVILVAAILAGLFFLPERFGEPDVVTNESGTQTQGDFVDLEPPAEPDYSTVVTDEAEAQELAAEARQFLEDMSGKEASANSQGQTPLLLSASQNLSWAGEDGSLGELLTRYGIQPQGDQLYFAHRVTREDRQGVWGIVQSGLLSRFAEGVAVRRGDNVETYKLLIPRHADERNADGSSSFLGKVIWHKTLNANVINTAQGWARQSVDFVVPDQDWVIVSFERQQLVSIYQHFAISSR